MASSGYTAITFVANEQPTTAKWNLIGSNDASFNTGNGFNDAIIKTRHLGTSADLKIPAGNIDGSSYPAFSAYRNGALSVGSGVIIFEVEDYDIGSNYNTSTGQFTAPVDGLYTFKASITLAASYTSYIWTNLLKNGTVYKRGMRKSSSNSNGSSIMVDVDIFLTAGDYVSVNVSAGGAGTFETGAVGGSMTNFYGRLISRN